MSLADIILIGVIAVVVILVIKNQIKKRKNGGSICGCGSSCTGCAGGCFQDREKK